MARARVARRWSRWRTLRLLRVLRAWMSHAAAGVMVVALAPPPQDMDIPVATQIPLFLKAITFDRHLHARAGSDIIVAIVYQSGNRASRAAKDDAMRAIGLARDSIDGKPVRGTTIDLDREPLGAALARQRATLMYVAPLRGVQIPGVAAAARAAQVTSAAGVPEYASLGLALAVRLQGDRPKLIVNVTASRLEGADFSAELLKLALVIP